jgi:hypothetical protein
MALNKKTNNTEYKKFKTQHYFVKNKNKNTALYIASSKEQDYKNQPVKKKRLQESKRSIIFKKIIILFCCACNIHSILAWVPPL